LQAKVARKPIDPLSERFPTLTEDEAYRIQEINANFSTKQGAKHIGYKIGLTSREAQKQFNISKPDFGHLFSDMSVLEERPVIRDSLIQPKIEGELAFILGRDLKGPGVTIIDVLSAVDAVVVCMEIVDSRVRDWKIRATDTIADNGSSALFVVSGVKYSIRGMSLAGLGMSLSQNGEVIATGAGSAVMGNPLSAVVFVANELGGRGKTLKEGQIILSGSLTAMLKVSKNDFFTCEVGGLSRLSLRFQ
jgi:2-oxopent-4-enoate hydratase